MLLEDLMVHGKRLISGERALSGGALKESSKCAPNGCESDSAEQPETVTS